ncbi:helix-turn-helix domain-containing protein [Halarcobacter sp.]|uniref:helix-turn-helix domain-containing protein n=1 Tax=Halarcobacter sp. TaxID=2321133 RepID=UPI003AFF6946
MLLLHLDIDEQEILDFHKVIAGNVKKIRKKKKVSQTDLALSIGHKSVSIVSKIEAGLESKHYNIEQLYKISKVLEVDIKEFFNFE